MVAQRPLPITQQLTRPPAECIYSKRWVPLPSATAPGAPPGSSSGGSDPAASQRSSTALSAAGPGQRASTAPSTSATAATTAARRTAETKAADDAKLIFGTVFSLRRLVRQLGGAEDQFLSYRTAEYKLHYFETPTQLKFLMLTDPRAGGGAGAGPAGVASSGHSLRTVLHQIWATLYVEYVVKSPLSPVEHAGGVGVANELFEGGLEVFLVSRSTCQDPRTNFLDRTPMVELYLEYC